MISQLNLLMSSGIPIISINYPVQERINVLEQIYVECANYRNVPIYLWNAGWGCLKQVQYNWQGKINFVNLQQPKFENIFTILIIF